MNDHSDQDHYHVMDSTHINTIAEREVVSITPNKRWEMDKEEDAKLKAKLEAESSTDTTKAKTTTTTTTTTNHATDDVPTAHVIITSTNFSPDEARSPNQHQTTTSFADTVMLSDLYILCICFGWFGVHHLVLGRRKWALLYFLTVGCFGIGVIVDLFRMPQLLKSRQKNFRNHGTNNFFVNPDESIRVSDLYALWGLGFLGLQQFYLGRCKKGIVYFFTFGLLGVGWVCDLFRIPFLVKNPQEKTLFEAYTYLIPLGLFGAHFFYLGEWKRGLVAFFTLNFLGVGFVVDLFRMPLLFKMAMERESLKTPTIA